MDFITFVVYLSIYIGLVATTFYILSFVADRKKEKLIFGDDELPFVSVIIPVYNEEKTIANTLDSILASDYPKEKLEIIVVDDASKDNSLAIARQFENGQVKVFHREVNGGSKAAAFNFGFTKVNGDFVISMDADTLVAPQTVKNMIGYFKNKDVMAVTPAMVISKAKNVLERVQRVEYLMGLFLRKAFAALNAIYITPGAFTAYRKSFFDKYGVYEIGNITEDLEMALRIQSHGYYIENCPEAPAYTTPMKTFKKLLIQRRRWYFGLIKNLLKYNRVVGSKYGDLGMFVIPVAVVSICFSVFVTTYLFFKTLFDVRKEILFLQNINFDFASILNVNLYAVEKSLFLFFTNPMLLFILVFMLVLGVYLYYASKKIGKVAGLIIDLPLFFLLFALLFGFWWIVSLFYVIFAKQIKWR